MRFRFITFLFIFQTTLSALEDLEPPVDQEKISLELFEEGKLLLKEQQPAKAIKIFQSLSEENPDNSEYFYYLGEAFKANDEFERAIDSYKHSIELSPYNNDSKVGIAYIYLKRNELNESEALFSEVLKKNPENVDALIGLATIKRRQDDMQTASALLHRAIAIEPKNPDVLNQLNQLTKLSSEEEKIFTEALQFIDEKNYPVAITSLNQLIQQHPTADYFFYLGQAFSRNGQREEAVHSFKKALDLNPNHQDAKVGLAYLILSQDQFTESEALFRSVLEKNPTYVDAVLGLGRMYQKIGQLKEAEDLYIKAYKINPEREEALFYLSELNQKDQPAEKKEFVESKVEKKSIGEKKKGEDELVIKAKEHVERKEFPAAIEIYKKLIEETPEKGEYFYLLGQAYNKSDQRNEAIIAFKKALELNPNDKDAMVSLGFAYLAEKNLDESENLFKRVVEESPNYTDAIIGLGRVKQLRNQDDEAKELYQKALALDPKNELALEYLNQMKKSDEIAQKKDDKEKIPLWAEELFKKANELEKKKKYCAALSIYKMLVSAFPKQADYSFKLGKLYVRMQQKELAKEAFYLTLIVDPKYHDARTALAYLYLFEDNLETSRILFEIVLSESSNHAEALAGMGRILMLKKQDCEAENFLLRALEKDSDQVNALIYYGQLLMRNNRPSEAKPLYIRLMQLEPEDRSFPLAFFGLQGRTDPSLLLRGSRSEEEEKDQLTGRIIARLIDWEERIEVYFPLNDRLRMATRFSHGEIKQINLNSKINQYDAWLNIFSVKGEWFYTPKWTFEFYGTTTFCSNRDRHSILHTIDGTFFTPGVAARYEDDLTRFNMRAISFVFITRDFEKREAYLVAIRDIGFTIERVFKHERFLGARGDYFFYDDRVSNRAIWLTAWAQTGIMPYEKIISLRYQVDYRHFKEEVPDYYSFEYQFTNWLALRFVNIWCDTLRIEAEYWHGFRFTRGENPESPLTPFVPQTRASNRKIITVYSYTNRLDLSITKTIRDRLQFNFYGSMTRDSFDYFTWHVEGNVIYRF